MTTRRGMLVGAGGLAVAAGTGATAQAPPGGPAAGGPLAGGPLAGGAAGPFETQPWGADSRIDGPHYAVERVRFASGGETLVGNLFLPKGGGPRGAVVLLGPVAFVKEQAPIQYAARLAREGLVALAFDPRFHGESTGSPRRLEDGDAKAADLRAALDFLGQRAEVDAARLDLLGICQGVNWVVRAAAADARVRRVALVAGHYLTPETALMYLGSREAVAARLARAQEARARQLRDGTVDYVPIVQARADQPDPGALLTALPIHQFYIPWADRGPARAYRGLWENRITAQSEAAIWGTDITLEMARLTQPLLMVHADRAASGPMIPRRLLDAAASVRKELVMLDGRNQLQFYEDPLTIDLVVPTLVRHFSLA